MTRFDEMDATDLRAELADWTGRALMFSREFLAAHDSGDVAWEYGIEVALRQALDQVRRLERLLKLGVAA